MESVDIKTEASVSDLSLRKQDLYQAENGVGMSYLFLSFSISPNLLVPLVFKLRFDFFFLQLYSTPFIHPKVIFFNIYFLRIYLFQNLTVIFQLLIFLLYYSTYTFRFYTFQWALTFTFYYVNLIFVFC
jgi:hypothetical protein